MAELINLQEADKYVQTAHEYLAAFRRNAVDARQRNLGLVWTNQQLDDLVTLFNGVLAVQKALIEVLHNNRDGRGSPPGQRR